MYRDVSNLNVGSCATIVDDKTIITFPDNYVNTYKLVSDKYYLSAQTYTGVTSYPAGTVCYTEQQINQLPSQWDFITPVFHFMAIISFMVILMIAYRLIIYPFFRRYV